MTSFGALNLKIQSILAIFSSPELWLVGELIVYLWSGVRPSSVVVRRPQFQT